MARSSVSDEEVQLRKRARRRLVGAIALVVLVVALAPLVLDRAPKSPTQPVDVQMPAASGQGGDAVSAGAAGNSGASPAGEALGAAGGQPAPETAAAAAAPGPAPDARGPGAESAVAPPARTPAAAATAGGQTASPVAPAPNEGPSAVPAAPPHPAAGGETAHAAADGYAVSIIATVSADKARALKQKLQKAKLPVYLEKTPDGGKTRVRVGPYKQKDAAERARQRLVKLGFDPGKVVPKGE